MSGQIQEALTELSGLIGASEMHGLMCGFSISCASDDCHSRVRRLLTSLESDGDVGRGERDLLESVCASVDQALRAGELAFEFEPMLPDDSVSLHQRISALAMWCQGFLYALGAGELKSDVLDDQEVREVLGDLQQISQVSDEAEDDDSDESAYMELVEFVRVAVMLLATRFVRDPEVTLH